MNFGVRSDGHPYAAVLLPELLDYLAKELAVEAQGKMATTWGKMKRDAVRKKNTRKIISPTPLHRQ